MPTALQLGRAGWQSYIEAARRRPASPELPAVTATERALLLERVRAAAATLKARFGARRVILFGSLAHSAWFAPDSDIDLAVEGLAGDSYWQAWRLVEELIGDRPVDLIEIETVGPSLLQAIQRYVVSLSTSETLLPGTYIPGAAQYIGDTLTSVFATGGQSAGRGRWNALASGRMASPNG
jgi:predicted nucleotidyltransferase